MIYPVAYICLNNEKELPDWNYLTSICQTTNMGVLQPDGIGCNFDQYITDYKAIFSATSDLSDFCHGNQVVAISCTEVPLLFSTAFSEHIAAIYWIRDVKTSFEIQQNDHLIPNLVNTIQLTSHQISARLALSFKRIKSRKKNFTSHAIDDSLARILEPT